MFKVTNGFQHQPCNSHILSFNENLLDCDQLLICFPFIKIHTLRRFITFLDRISYVRKSIRLGTYTLIFVYNTSPVASYIFVVVSSKLYVLFI